VNLVSSNSFLLAYPAQTSPPSSPTQVAKGSLHSRNVCPPHVFENLMRPPISTTNLHQKKTSVENSSLRNLTPPKSKAQPRFPKPTSYPPLPLFAEKPPLPKNPSSPSTLVELAVRDDAAAENTTEPASLPPPLRVFFRNFPNQFLPVSTYAVLNGTLRTALFPPSVLPEPFVLVPF